MECDGGLGLTPALASLGGTGDWPGPCSGAPSAVGWPGEERKFGNEVERVGKVE